MRSLRIIIVALALGFFATIGTYAYVHIQWSRVMPRQPDPGSGRTHQLTVDHGYRVFVSERELRWERFLASFGLPLALAGFAGAAFLNQRFRPFANRGSSQRVSVVDRVDCEQ